MFALLETCSRRFELEDYSLSQTSLEQVFLRFAQEQHSDEMEREGHFGPAGGSDPTDRLLRPYDVPTAQVTQM
jgi:hypothetical protein